MRPPHLPVHARVWTAVTLGCSLTLGGMTLVAAQPAAPVVSACPVLDVGNPHPGDTLTTGDLIVSGVAFDPITGSASGVSHVDFFLGARDQGGTIIGTAIPGQASFNNPRAFETTLTIPDVSRDDTLVVYAMSANSGATTTIAMPVRVNPQTTTKPTGNPTPTPVPVEVTTKLGCATVNPGPVVAAGTRVVVTGPAAVATTTAPVVAVTQANGPTLVLGNPNPNDVLFRTMVVSGLAYDPGSAQGSGVDQVQFFIGSRDAGGVAIGTAVPGAAFGSLPNVFTTTVEIPQNVSGGRNFVAYARSLVTGRETVVSVPVFVGAPPSPTPR